MAEKPLWRLEQRLDTLWGRVMSSKYCPDSSLVEWLRNPIKTHKNISIGWKALALAFPLVGNLIAWRIGNVIRVRINEDPWEGVGEGYRLPEPLILQL